MNHCWVPEQVATHHHKLELCLTNQKSLKIFLKTEMTERKIRRETVFDKFSMIGWECTTRAKCSHFSAYVWDIVGGGPLVHWSTL